MLRIRDRDFGASKIHQFNFISIRHLLGLVATAMTALALFLALILSESLSKSRSQIPAAELLARLDSHRRFCSRVFDNLRPVMTVASKSQEMGLRESALLRKAIDKEKVALRQSLSGSRLQLLLSKIVARDPGLYRRVLQKVKVLQMLEDSSLSMLSSEAEATILRLAASEHMPPREEITKQLLSLIDRQQSYYLTMADSELAALENDLMPLLD